MQCLLDNFDYITSDPGQLDIIQGTIQKCATFPLPSVLLQSKATKIRLIVNKGPINIISYLKPFTGAVFAGADHLDTLSRQQSWNHQRGNWGLLLRLWLQVLWYWILWDKNKIWMSGTIITIYFWKWKQKQRNRIQAQVPIKY